MARKRTADHDTLRYLEEEALRDPDFASQSRIAREMMKAGYAHFVAHNGELTKAHIIPLSATQEHLALLVDLSSIMGQPSAVSLSAQEWSIPSDLDGWKPTREQLASLASTAEELAREIDVAVGSETFCAAISEIGAENRFQHGLAALNDLVEVFAVAASLRKPTNAKGGGAGGRRRNPHWVREFVVAAQTFWVKCMSGGTKPTFLKGQASEGANAFTKWIVDLYRRLAPPGTTNLAMFRTELERLPAMRRRPNS
ncbi:MAG: hypothetical protein EOR97_13060 [Mesorhizobium sp.]|uniref:hypothetical protein n=1 Tax=Mesorhizobium sp. TaxID=1871066 RepID=UPI000FE75FC0|nr:hypothetical protein [Mesorhizobium sp.]RWN31110.1 MAG: hypothetical protein EOR97_13060 [Mesorhizobium sp.]